MIESRTVSAEIERRAGVEPHLLERIAPWQRASEIEATPRFGWYGATAEHGQVGHRFDSLKHPRRGRA